MMNLLSYLLLTCSSAIKIADPAQSLTQMQTKASIGMDLKNEVQLRVNLESEDDALYVGTIYMGAPQGQAARVVFDTGSEYLAVTGALCNNQSAGKYHFAEENQFKHQISLDYLMVHDNSVDDDLEIETSDEKGH